jgi:perosamine synthetase
MSEFIPVNEPIFEGNEKKYLNECIDTGWVSSEGPFVEKFEKGMASITSRKFSIAVSSGTAALDIAVEALGIGEGDEVIMPTFTIISCIHQIIRSKAKPVFIDSDLYSWNMNVDQIESKITDQTKAIMVVHIYGLPVDMDPVLSLAKKYNLKIIEDAAELIGQTYKGLPCGSFGDISTMSFYPNKHITSGEGGMVFTDDEEIAKKCYELRNLCFQKEKRFVHHKIGWNYRMTNIQAALGLAQLEQLKKFLIKKREIGSIYNSILTEFDYLQLPLNETKYAENIYWVYGIILKDNLKITVSELMQKLAKKGIGTRPFFYPMHKQPILNKMNIIMDNYYPISEKLSDRGFYLPSGLGLSTEKIPLITKELINVINV